MIMRLTQAVEIWKTDITLYFVSTLYGILDIGTTHHDGFRIGAGLAHPTALLEHPQGIALEMLVGYFSERS
jgi:hypothetical protein